MAKRILIFDDDTDILAICSYILEEQGWDVHTRTNCNNIIETLEEIKPNVILMDNWIPDTGGIIATQLIKEHPSFKSIPVIYFSANNDIKTLAKQAGADTFLAKPFDISELEEVVNSVSVQASENREKE
jgi:DNA-binding NtrC family response regulator